MDLKKFKNELINSIDSLNITDFFKKIQEEQNIIYSETTFKTLMNKFVQGKTDTEYYESLKTFTLTIQEKKLMQENNNKIDENNNLTPNFFVGQIREWLPSLSVVWQKAIAFVLILLFLIGIVFSIAVFVLKVSPTGDIKEAIPIFIILVGFASLLLCLVVLAKVSKDSKVFQIFLASIAMIFVITVIIWLSIYTYEIMFPADTTEQRVRFNRIKNIRIDNSMVSFEYDNENNGVIKIEYGIYSFDESAPLTENIESEGFKDIGIGSNTIQILLPNTESKTLKIKLYSITSSSKKDTVPFDTIIIKGDSILPLL